MACAWRYWGAIMTELPWWGLVLIFVAGEFVGLFLGGLGRCAHCDSDEGHGDELKS